VRANFEGLSCSWLTWPLARASVCSGGILDDLQRTNQVFKYMYSVWVLKTWYVGQIVGLNGLNTAMRALKPGLYYLAVGLSQICLIHMSVKY
jgi:hypothetical protein